MLLAVMKISSETEIKSQCDNIVKKWGHYEQCKMGKC